MREAERLIIEIKQASTDQNKHTPELANAIQDMIKVAQRSAMNAESCDPDTASAVAGLELTRRTIEQFINILGEGPLVDSNTQKTYMVRADNLGTLISGNTLRDAIRALNGNGQVTATISSATVTATKMGILTAAAVS